MKKIYDFVEKINGKLASYGADRYLHLIVGMIVSFIAAVILGYNGETTYTCVGFGLLIAIAVGFLKEVADQTFEGMSDFKDWLFTIIGGVIGSLMFIF